MSDKSEIPVFTQAEYSKHLQPEIDQPVSEQTTDPVNDAAWKIQDEHYENNFGWPT